MKIALLQTKVYREKMQNLEIAESYLKTAKELGAEIAVLPEMFNTPYETEMFRKFCEERYGETWEKLSKMAEQNKIVLIGGTVPEKEDDRLYNTSYVFNEKGDEIARHRKMHLFDVDIKGKQSFKESDSFCPGDDTCVFEYEGHKLGLAICFDIRFPEYFRNLVLEGAEVIFVPAAFNMTTGPMHWELSFRMRAVDNQCFTVGVAPARDRCGKYISYANSIVCDPWGRVMCNAGEKPGVTVCDIDLNEVETVRQQLPILSARRPDMYYLKKEV